MNMEHGWNNARTRKKKKIYLKENLSQCHLPTTNHKWTGQAVNQAFVDKRLETNHLSHSKAPVQCRCYMFSMVTWH
jgi:Na+-transporting NADH:ubiquinone oxidoreductase subunit NqrF